ncbi:MAG: lipase family protein [Pseudomonadota bacterium]
MTSIICETSEAEKKTQALLSKQIPHHRQAYSDRTAWLMACLSELSYLRFNPIFADDGKDKLLTKLMSLVHSEKHEMLNKFIDRMVYDHEAEKQKLIAGLKDLNMSLVETFDQKGTQAILVRCDHFIALAFRGTEPAEVRDLIADGNIATTPCDHEGKVHTGFSDAYEAVSEQIQTMLNQDDDLADKPLFITGHSLGGALATLATKRLTHRGGIAACYTFGSPRVGNSAWVGQMRTPVYRVVNAADFVTILPPSGVLISALGGVAQFVPKFGTQMKKWISGFGGYLHCGNMRYLTNCRQGDYTDVQLLYSVDLPYRIKGLIANQMTRWNRTKKTLADHSISIYRKKLSLIASRRNNL